AQVLLVAHTGQINSSAGALQLFCTGSQNLCLFLPIGAILQDFDLSAQKHIQEVIALNLAVPVPSDPSQQELTLDSSLSTGGRELSAVVRLHGKACQHHIGRT